MSSDVSDRATEAEASLLSVNVAKMRLIELSGTTVKTGIYKYPVEGRVGVRENQVGTDRQADYSVHGGSDKAVYAYAAEDYGWWSEQLQRELEPGAFGENLTITGIDLTRARVGERWRIGTTLLEVSEPRQPCSKLGHKIGDMRFVKQFAKALRPGAYLRIIEEGELGAGDAIEVVERPGHEVTMELMSRVAFGEKASLPKLLEAEALPSTWRAAAEAARDAEAEGDS